VKFPKEVRGFGVDYGFHEGDPSVIVARFSRSGARMGAIWLTADEALELAKVLESAAAHARNMVKDSVLRNVG
jgi:hypothetical protein